MSVDELLCLLRKAMRGDQLVLVATAAEHIHVVGAAEAHHRLGQRIEHRLQVECRAADGLKHFRRRGLLLQRFALFGQEPGILDRDHGLRRKILKQGDLLVRKCAHLLAVEHDDSDERVIFDQRHQ